MPLTLGQVRNSVRTNTKSNEGQLPNPIIDDLINQAIDLAKGEDLLRLVADETLEQLDDTYEYGLTGGVLDDMLAVLHVYEEKSSTDNEYYYAQVPVSLYRLEYGDPPFIHLLDAGWSPEGDKHFRVEGYVPQGRVVAGDDDAVIYLPDGYIVQRASALAHGWLSSGASSQLASWHAGRVQVCEAYAETARINAHEYKIRSGTRRIPGRY